MTANETQFEPALRERLAIVDALRGFALVGVLFANFTGYTDQQVPEVILKSHSGWIDFALMDFNAIFIEYKFITLFCVLFGYSFGLLMESIARQGASREVVFGRRMAFLFLIGFVHCSFWWFDVLHIYAICGLFLLFFYKSSPRTILIWALVLHFGVPFIYFWIMHNAPDTMNDADWLRIYENFKRGDLLTLVTSNYTGYYNLFIKPAENLYFFPETHGKILFGVLLYRMEFFNETSLRAFNFSKWLWISGGIALCYLTLQYFQRTDELRLAFYLRPLTQLGVLSTAAFYSLILIRFYLSRPESLITRGLVSLGRMTLTNYLLVSAVMIVTLYGIGFGMLGDLPMRTIWLMGVGWLFVEILFSAWWLKRFRHGPIEGLWRKFTWWNRSSS